MQNPNDNTADIYDIVSKPLKPQVLTDAELELIKSLVEPGASILDIGAGTGRHAIPLAEAGYDVTVIDSASQMLNQLKAKSTKLQIIEADILNFKFSALSFDLIIMMWNAWNEIALTDTDASSLLKKLSVALKPGGKILINIDNPANFDPSQLTFAISQKERELDYSLDSRVIKFDPNTRTTTSLEHVVVYDGEIPVRQTNSEIVQRWWNLEEIKSISHEAGLNLRLHEIPLNAEYYIELTQAS
jgi:ubiquinone/menaquinone biosynthesis C-methylase UbiE